MVVLSLPIFSALLFKPGDGDLEVQKEASLGSTLSSQTCHNFFLCNLGKSCGIHVHLLSSSATHNSKLGLLMLFQNFLINH